MAKGVWRDGRGEPARVVRLRTIWSAREFALDVGGEEVAEGITDLGLGLGHEEVRIVVRVALRDAWTGGGKGG